MKTQNSKLKIQKFMLGMVFCALISFYLLFTAIPAFATGATLSLSPATGTFNKGCVLSVEIKVDTGGAQSDGTDAILIFDPSRLTASTSTIRQGTIYSNYPGNVVDTQSGKVTISGLATQTTPFNGSGTLATVDFTVLDTAPPGATQIKFDFSQTDKTKTTDSNVVERTTIADILNQVNDGSYVIGSGTCTAGGTSGGASGGGIGGISTPSATPIPIITPVVLPERGDFQPTLMIAIFGGILTALGILGAVFL